MTASGSFSCQNPLGASLDKFIHHQAHIGKGEAADVKAKEFGCMTGA
jgi:hypothetical protein